MSHGLSDLSPVDEGLPQRHGFGGYSGLSFLDDHDRPIIQDEDHYDISGEDVDSSTLIRALYHLVNMLEYNMEHEGISSKPHKIPTHAPEKPGKRKYVLKHGEKTLEKIPLLQTKAMAGFVNDPLVPHAYLVKTA